MKDQRHRAVLGFVLLLLVCSPVTLWRIQLESNLWIDETYSLLLTTFPVDRLVEVTAQDSHPPLYYLALKAWLKAGRLLGLEPGAAWGRLLNGAFWILLVAASWFFGRRLWGTLEGSSVAFLVASGAYAALFARDMRSYGIATVALFIAYLAAMARYQRPDRGRPLWLLYVLTTGLALWSHLLSAAFLAVLGLILLLVAWSKKDRALVGWLMSAHGAALLLFAPWIPGVIRQFQYIERSQPDWMTPAGLSNLGWVFAFWLPFGRVGFPDYEGNQPLVFLGIASLLVLIGFLFWAAWAGKRSVEPPLLLGGTVALATCVAYILGIWVGQLLGLAHTFHGPRYPALAANFWLGGLALLTLWGARRLDRPRWVAVGVLAPLVLCSAVGQIKIAREEARWGLAGAWTEAAALLPEEGGDVYLMPSEFRPFYRETFQAFHLREVEQMDCDASSPVTIVDVGFWHSQYRGHDALIFSALQRGPSVQLSIPKPQEDFTIYQGPLPEMMPLAALCRRGWQSPKAVEIRLREREVPSVALPEDQVAGVPWSFLEVGQGGETARWAGAHHTSIRFDRPLPKGEYTLHLQGYRQPFPQAVQTLKVRLRGETGWIEQIQPAGPFHLELPLSVAKNHARPRVEVVHALWSPAEQGLGADSRQLSFLFYGAWFEIAPG